MKTCKKWRKWQLVKEAICLIIVLIGVILFVQSFLTGGVTKEAWKFISGFVLAFVGALSWCEINNETYSEYKKKTLEKNRKKARH